MTKLLSLIIIFMFVLPLSAFAQDINKANQESAFIKGQMEFIEIERKFISEYGKAGGRLETLQKIVSRSDKSIFNITNDSIIDLHLEHAANKLHILGFNPGNIISLSNQGIDVIEAVLAGPYLTNTHKAILSEYVISAKISSISIQNLNDGYNTSISIIPSTVYKRNKSTNKLVIRANSYKDKDDQIILEDGFQPELLEDYIFFLSNSMYDFYTEIQSGSKPIKNGGNEFTINLYYPLHINGLNVTSTNLLSDGESSNITTVVQSITAGIK